MNKTFEHDPRDARLSSSEDDTLYECIICIDDVRTRRGHIWQCPQGHVLCCSCFQTLGGPDSFCPVCKTVLSSIRCHILENLRDKNMKQLSVLKTDADPDAHLRSIVVEAGVAGLKEVATDSAADGAVWLGDEHDELSEAGTPAARYTRDVQPAGDLHQMEEHLLVEFLQRREHLLVAMSSLREKLEQKKTKLMVKFVDETGQDNSNQNAKTNKDPILSVLHDLLRALGVQYHEPTELEDEGETVDLEENKEVSLSWEKEQKARNRETQRYIAKLKREGITNQSVLRALTRSLCEVGGNLNDRGVVD